MNRDGPEKFYRIPARAVRIESAGGVMTEEMHVSQLHRDRPEDFYRIPVRAVRIESAGGVMANETRVSNRRADPAADARPGVFSEGLPMDSCAGPDRLFQGG